MADETEEARLARAKQLRESIKKEIAKPGQAGGEDAKPKSPRDKIHDRMRELDKKR